jgi:hypothetical protein
MFSIKVELHPDNEFGVTVTDLASEKVQHFSDFGVPTSLRAYGLPEYLLGPINKAADKAYKMNVQGSD